LVRGLYYEGWDPAEKPIKPDRGEFLSCIRKHFPKEPELDAEKVARSTFKVLFRHLTEGEIDDIKQLIPEDLRGLWPQRGL
jgi:uncharacterized protein (DUF2267 family)